MIKQLLKEVDRECAKNAFLVLDQTEKILIKKARRGLFCCEQYRSALEKYVRARIIEKRLKTDLRREESTAAKEANWFRSFQLANELKKVKDEYLV